MIYVCSQPDSPYFFWQLEVQLYNFKRMGIDLSKVHQVFVSQRPMSEEYKAYKAAHPEVEIHWYPDTRKSRGYIPSMRPNALKQHFAAFPELEGEVVFYHDADIIFRELPDFEKLREGYTWYLSDTTSYLDSDYVKSKGSGILVEMCNIVGVNSSDIEAIKKDSGGAQYVMKGVTSEFWSKVEDDCEALYKYMNESVPKWAKEFALKTGQPESSYHSVQSWTADMWAVLWNAVLFGHKVSVVPELSFSWATDSLDSYNKHNIFHNAGATGNNDGKIFYKGEYIHKSPFGVDFSRIDRNTASSMYVREIIDCGTLKMANKFIDLRNRNPDKDLIELLQIEQMEDYKQN